MAGLDSLQFKEQLKKIEENRNKNKNKPKIHQKVIAILAINFTNSKHSCCRIHQT
ncbi:MAG TPA: hypothetical protein VFP49_03775 [Nitrososphaeraceae archaeon]|nr:hypothetical protein [Nitrososphaeraceae archaeon]